MGIFKAIFGFLKKLWKALRVVLVIVLICLAIFFSFGGALVVLGVTFTGGWAALLAVGLAFLVDPETATDAVMAVGKAVGTATGALIAAVGTGVGAAASGSGLLGLLAVGLGIWWFMNRESDQKAQTTARGDTPTSDPLGVMQ